MTAQQTGDWPIYRQAGRSEIRTDRSPVPAPSLGHTHTHTLDIDGCEIPALTNEWCDRIGNGMNIVMLEIGFNNHFCNSVSLMSICLDVNLCSRHVY